MSRYTYAGEFKNPTTGFYVKEIEDARREGGVRYEVWVRADRASDGSAPKDRPHTNGKKFGSVEAAEEWIEGLSEFFESDYDEFLEENHSELARMERYEAFRNER